LVGDGAVMSGYKGPDQIGWAYWPGRGTTYHGDFDGHDVQVFVTEKRKRVRVFVDGKEYKP
jgi:hypothetical protein